MICVCGKEFEGKRKTARFCSARCRKLAFLSVPNPRTVKCRECDIKDLENKKLSARIVLLEAELRSLRPRAISVREVGATEWIPPGDSTKTPQLEKGFGWTPSGGLITKKYNIRPIG